MPRINLDIQATHCYRCGVPLVVLPSQRVACPRGHWPAMRTNRNTREYIERLAGDESDKSGPAEILTHAAGFLRTADLRGRCAPTASSRSFPAPTGSGT